MDLGLGGKVALVAAASKGLGKATALRLALEGAQVAICARHKQTLDRTLAEIETATRRPALAIQADVSEESTADRLVKTCVDRYGRLDILVVASGINQVNPVEEMAPDTFTGIMDVNVSQSWLMARAAARQMKAQGRGGRIILISSARGLLGHPAGYTAYCASKAAVDGIVRALGCELGSWGITANAIGPTVFRSPLTAWMFEDNEEATRVRTGFLSRVPRGRLGEPEDLAGPLLFLASDASDFYTGHTLYADGGYTAG